MTIASSARRVAILEAATRLFEHYGHAKTTVADVAREAHVGVGTVYLEFDSKEAIVQELSQSTHVLVLDAMRAASEETDEHAARLAAVLHARTSCFVDLRKKGHHACELVHCKAESVRTAHQRFCEQEHRLLERLVKEGQDAGAFAAGAPSSFAALIQRAFVSLSPPWIFGCDEDPMRASKDLCQLLLHGLLASSPSANASRARSSPAKSRPAASSPARKTARRTR